MSYTDTANRPNPVAAFGALGIPAGIGALLVAGLAVTGVIPIAPPNPDARWITVPIEPIEPPPPPDTTVEPDTTKSTVTQSTTTVVPDITIAKTDLGDVIMDDFPILDGPGSLGDPIVVPIPTPPAPTPRFDPIEAAPRGNPGSWITDRDYRSSWIRREYTGVAGFTLQINAEGRVTNCSITRSTGHSALDEATCKLLQRRGEFTPARDSSGNVTSGTYSNSVNWVLP